MCASGLAIQPLKKVLRMAAKRARISSRFASRQDGAVSDRVLTRLVFVIQATVKRKIRKGRRRMCHGIDIPESKYYT